MNMTEFNNLSFQDMNKMDFDTLKKLVSQKGKSANKRLDRISGASGISKSAIREVQSSGGRFSVKGKDKIQLIGEAKRIQTFNRSKSGTVSGAKKTAKEAIQAAKDSGVKVQSKTKRKSKKKSLSKIHSDITKKAKKIEEEKGKEAAVQYQKRARAQEEAIRQKRKKEREAKKREKEAKPKQSTVEEPIPDNELTEEDVINDFDDTVEKSKDEINNKYSDATLVVFDGVYEYEVAPDGGKLYKEFMAQPDLGGQWSDALSLIHI